MGGDTDLTRQGHVVGVEFQSQVAILGWGYLAASIYPARLKLFQSQVAILGWGYTGLGNGGLMRIDCFNRRWRFLGGDTRWDGTNTPAPRCFNRRWRFLGGDTFIRARFDSICPEFQSQVAILGWGYGGGGVASN